MYRTITLRTPDGRGKSQTFAGRVSLGLSARVCCIQRWDQALLRSGVPSGPSLATSDAIGVVPMRLRRRGERLDEAGLRVVRLAGLEPARRDRPIQRGRIQQVLRERARQAMLPYPRYGQLLRRESGRREAAVRAIEDPDELHRVAEGWGDRSNQLRRVSRGTEVG